MKRYMDFTEYERSQMTEEKVLSLLKPELMDKGIIPLPEPDYLTEECVEADTKTYYRPVIGDRWDGEINCVFRTHKEAEEFLELKPLRLKTGYSGETPVAITPEEVKVETIQCEEESANPAREAARKAAASNKTTNKNLKEEYEKSIKDSAEATQFVWNDWHEMGRKHNDSQRIIDTYNDYFETCDKDTSMAMKFLLKAFDAETISDAFEFIGLAHPCPADVAEERVEL